MLATIRTGLNASLQQLDVLSHNMANANTAGFKRSMISFQDIYAEAAAAEQKVGLGARVENMRQMRSQGPLKQTGQTLDLAIEGQGLFVLSHPDQTGPDQVGLNAYYTRDGGFQLDNDGFIISGQGHYLMSVLGAPIQIPRREVIGGETVFLEKLSIDEKGRVLVQLGDLIEREIASIALAMFDDPARLAPAGMTMFRATTASGEAEMGTAFQNQYGKMISGALELANVNMTSELTAMLQAQQSFSASSRLLQAESDMLRQLMG